MSITANRIREIYSVVFAIVGSSFPIQLKRKAKKLMTSYLTFGDKIGMTELPHADARGSQAEGHTSAGEDGPGPSCGEVTALVSRICCVVDG